MAARVVASAVSPYLRGVPGKRRHSPGKSGLNPRTHAQVSPLVTREGYIGYSVLPYRVVDALPPNDDWPLSTPSFHSRLPYGQGVLGNSYCQGARRTQCKVSLASNLIGLLTLNWFVMPRSIGSGRNLDEEAEEAVSVPIV